jgi:L-iditol 2-dehydrogenase
MATNFMKAAVLHGVKDLRVEEVEAPEADHGEVLVKVRAATTCGTDLKIFQRGYVDRVITLPTIFGHEWAGDVVEVGQGLEWPKRSMRVRAGNSAPCLRCAMCQKGKYNLCENMIWLWGAYAEYIKVPARMVLVNMQEIPESVSYEEAAVVEPLACVLHGHEEIGVELGDTVVIIGAGPIGLLHLLSAKKIGAERTIVIDAVDERLDFAQRLGASETVNASREDVEQRIRSLTGGYGADVVIEAIGLPATWEQALKLVRRGGRALEFGGCPLGTEIQVNAEHLHYDELTVMGTFHTTPLHFKKALNLIASKTIDVRPLVTRKVRLDDINNAFDILLTSKKEIKISIIP